MTNRLAIYAAPELGAYGYHEKEWYLPGVRLNSFLAELEARGLHEAVRFREAGPASDADLQLFHSAAHIERVRARCAANEGSLDTAPQRIVEDAVLLLGTVRGESAGEGPAPRDAVRTLVEPALTPALTLEQLIGFLEGDGLLAVDQTSAALRITAAGQDFIASERPRLPGPTLARAHVERAARHVAGAALDATRRILAGELETVFLPIAGFHHAHREEARLYCLYNDPALALSCALPQLQGNLAYVDIDVHHGDGVYEAFADEPRVHIVDLHEDVSTLFPFTPEAPGAGDFWGRRDAIGRGAGLGTKLNIPLAPHTTDAQYLALWEEAEAFLRAARPQFIVFESGVDGLESDPMSNQRLSPAAIHEVTRRVRALAQEYAAGRLLVLGGGGYDPTTVAAAWVTVVEALTRP